MSIISSELSLTGTETEKKKSKEAENVTVTSEIDETALQGFFGPIENSETVNFSKPETKDFCAEYRIQRFLNNLLISKNEVSKYMSFCEKSKEKIKLKSTSTLLINATNLLSSKLRIRDYKEGVGLGLEAVKSLKKGSYMLYSGLIRSIPSKNKGKDRVNEYGFSLGNIDENTLFMVDGKHFRNYAACANAGISKEEIAKKFNITPPELVSTIVTPNAALVWVWLEDLQIICPVLKIELDIIVKENEGPVPILVDYGPKYMNEIGESLRLFTTSGLLPKSNQPCRTFELTVTNPKTTEPNVARLDWDAIETLYKTVKGDDPCFLELSDTVRVYLCKEEMQNILKYKGEPRVKIMSHNIMQIEDAAATANKLCDILKEEFTISPWLESHEMVGKFQRHQPWLFTRNFKEGEAPNEGEFAIMFSPVLDESTYKRVIEKLSKYKIDKLSITYNTRRSNNSRVYFLNLNSTETFYAYRQLFLQKPENKVTKDKPSDNNKRLLSDSADLKAKQEQALLFSKLSSTSAELSEKNDHSTGLENKQMIDENTLASLLGPLEEPTHVCCANKALETRDTQKALSKVPTQEFCKDHNIQRFLHNLILHKNDVENYKSFCKEFQNSAAYKMSSTEFMHRNKQMVYKLQLGPLKEGGSDLGGFVIDTLPAKSMMLLSGLIRFVPKTSNSSKNPAGASLNSLENGIKIADFGDDIQVILDCQKFRNHAAFLQASLDKKDSKDSQEEMVLSPAKPNVSLKTVWLTDLEILCPIVLLNEKITIKQGDKPIPLVANFTDPVMTQKKTERNGASKLKG